MYFKDDFAFEKGIFGKRLKEERVRMGFRLCQFSNETGIDETQISGYENRGQLPTFHSLIACAKVLDCSIDYLVGLEEA